MTHHTCTYDEAGRLTGMQTAEGVWLYTYDMMGNRLTSEFRPNSADSKHLSAPAAE